METVILFSPLVGAIIAGFGWRYIGEAAAQYITTGLLMLAALLSWIVFLTHGAETEQIHILDFIQSGTLDTSWSIRLDRLTSTMLIVVTTVSALVHLYSFGYMAHDENFSKDQHYKARFFAYLSFFTFAMLMLVTADNLVQMFFGWEGVGVASYLLIGFYWKKQSAGAAAIKAFVVNRVGDFGFALGIFGIFMLTDSIDFDVIFASAPELAETTIRFLWTDWNAANLLAFLLFVGAMGKSAQLILHTWLPDAMEGPTPVSALIHAATMVTAGVFLVCRMSPLMEFAPDAMAFVTFLGATTAFFAATVGLVQNDIKRVIAYSTCSQLGYMFVAAGVGVYSVAMFHLFTHAFFKAMLFLGAGSVIHGMHHEQDMRNYGGLRKKLPYTFWAMMIGTFAITGVGIPLSGWVGFAGFASKDAVIESAYAATHGGYAFWMLVIAALFTSFYSWRLIFLTFYGKARGDKHTHDHAHESPTVMLVPLGVLALGAVFAGAIWYSSFFGKTNEVVKFFGGHYEEPAKELAKEVAENNPKASKLKYVMAGEPGEAAIYMKPENTVLHEAHYVPTWVKLSPFVSMVLGLLTAMWFYIWSPEMPKRVATHMRPLYLFLLNKWYFDEIYDAIIVRPARLLGTFLWKRGDGQVIDGALNGIAMGIVPFFTRLAGRAQSGYIFTYAFAMVIGLVVLITWATLGGGAN
ncbi:NADH-quinone oxidoreductase subunit L [Cognatishimia activa]|uniref:NADH-quinone oxidoreductase subunit L n=1 Tax=Cognatishimia activa TaxID=1715691 RepID=A0A0P1IU12_9RHOB|nr:NADH-quinone oxidoreductase subunit L [Cognatishimia activa]CUJ22108.1 NADH-quinone oxidoreductase subunit L [Cognatishimia activa]CUK25438.1 NADH-quinone oxidoreductase subunit L [Cognatishimia activa]